MTEQTNAYLHGALWTLALYGAMSVIGQVIEFFQWVTK
jgi:hypothetical protein